MTFKISQISDQNGRIAIVTGANSGLGYETTLGLAKTGMKVIMACRSAEKGTLAKQSIEKEVENPDLEVLTIDLNSLQSVRNFAQHILDKYDRLDLLINNAGIMIPPFSKTEDGFESQMGVNYFSHFLLTNLLFPLVEKTPDSRIVSLSSIAHEKGKIDFKNLNAEQHYSRMKAYQQSKLACLMFAIELQHRIDRAGKKVISVAAHPGVSGTNLGRFIPKFLYVLAWPFMIFMAHSPQKAALPTLMAALEPNAKGGEYYGPQGMRGMKGKPGITQPEPHAFDEKVAQKLWTISEDLTGKKFTIA
ncbi:oxidoreductase [Salinivirga cyanobacteriivorans]